MEGRPYWHAKIIELRSNGQLDKLMVMATSFFLFSLFSCLFNGDIHKVFAFVHWYYSIGDIIDLCAQRPAQRKKWYAFIPQTVHCIFLHDMKACRLLGHQRTHAIKPPSNHRHYKHRRLFG